MNIIDIAARVDNIPVEAQAMIMTDQINSMQGIHDSDMKSSCRASRDWHRKLYDDNMEILYKDQKLKDEKAT